jgi:RNA polymerase-binding transcription factor DksA
VQPVLVWYYLGMSTEHKTKLEEEKATLLGQLGAIGTQDPATGAWETTAPAADAAEIADANTAGDRFEDFEAESAVMSTLTARLAEVEAALGRIEHGGYGVCRVCSNPIEEARLGANPAAETCMQHVEA